MEQRMELVNGWLSSSYIKSYDTPRNNSTSYLTSNELLRFTKRAPYITPILCSNGSLSLERKSFKD
jgi:hypothetical protein